MSNLESIVPPVELCKQIPEGEFEDSALVWVDGNTQNQNSVFVEPRRYAIDGTHRPAPTLEETITTLLTYGWLVKIDCRIQLDTFVELYSRTSNMRYAEYGPSACDAALRLWFKVKGIEVEI